MKVHKLSISAIVAGLFVFFSPLASASDVKTGEYLYNKNCLICHGASPTMIGTKVLSNRLPGNEAILLERRGISDVYVRAITRNGLGIMPGFRKTEISDGDLDLLIQFMASKGAVNGQ